MKHSSGSTSSRLSGSRSCRRDSAHRPRSRSAMSLSDEKRVRAHADRLNRDLREALQQPTRQLTPRELFQRLPGYWPVEVHQALVALMTTEPHDLRLARIVEQLNSSPAEDPNSGYPGRHQ